MTDPATRPDLDALADDVRYAGGNGTSDYWRGFNDGIDRLRERLLMAQRDAAPAAEPVPLTLDALTPERLMTTFHEHKWSVQAYGDDVPMSWDAILAALARPEPSAQEDREGDAALLRAIPVDTQEGT